MLSSILDIAVALLCAIGIYISLRMTRKFDAARRGELAEPSVVTSPRARIGGVPNARIGLIYYGLLLLTSPFVRPSHPLVLGAALVASILAALASLFLAYSLLFITRQPCTYCWTGHAINWALLVILISLATVK
ncbi:MAG: hypothetical protein JO098_08395 [Candidatus Eremiobacteraeota bacterium]|nr:hypothetical protein [Candidatus Eremiobacteraeota bacterium]